MIKIGGFLFQAGYILGHNHMLMGIIQFIGNAKETQVPSRCQVLL